MRPARGIGLATLRRLCSRRPGRDTNAKQACGCPLAGQPAVLDGRAQPKMGVERNRMSAVQSGSRAALFSLPGLDGKELSLEETLDRGPVLLAFFKSSCPVCQFTLPFIERYHRFFRDTKADIWLVSQDDREETAEFMKVYDLTMPVLLDDTRRYPVSNAYNIDHVPTTFLIGQAGDILHTSEGFHRQDLVQIARKLETLTGKKGFVPFTEDDEVPSYRPG
jgi:peroxiredoxin